MNLNLFLQMIYISLYTNSASSTNVSIYSFQIVFQSRAYNNLLNTLQNEVVYAILEPALNTKSSWYGTGICSSRACYKC